MFLYLQFNFFRNLMPITIILILKPDFCDTLIGNYDNALQIWQLINISEVVMKNCTQQSTETNIKAVAKE